MRAMKRMEQRAGGMACEVATRSGISRTLPAFQTTPGTFTPAQAVEFAFTCAMNMVRGNLIVED